MNKKGFTLIELLAVIVILAIIALIATPIVLNIISDTKQESELRSAGFYLDAVELSIAQAILDGQNITDNTYNILSNGNICLKYKSDNTTCEEELKVEVKGSLPQSGKIKISPDGKVAIAISNETTCYVKGYEDSDVTTIEDLEDCHIPGEVVVKTIKDLAVKSDFTDNEVASCLTDKSRLCEPGTKVTIQVNKTETQNFYVIIEESDKVVLIMDRNLGEGVKWNDNLEVADGPIRALQYLEDQTSEWENITPKTYVIQDENEPKVYADITRTNARARLLNKYEAEFVGCSINDSNCPDWLDNNLDEMMVDEYAYWTSFAYSGAYGAYVIMVGNYFSSSSPMWVLNGEDMCGVRPVIEIATQ